ncbi:MAG: amidophosphoribosyltransferase [Paludibacteraceae bacterium]|nr:amidophosphoribosyltransferase [Paludibacteraceae bacterium]
MFYFTIKEKESWLRAKEGNKKCCLHHDTIAFFHSEYYGGGAWKKPGTIENMICTLKNDRSPYPTDNELERCEKMLKSILEEDLNIIDTLIKKSPNPFMSLVVCVVPRAKKENYYQPNQKLFRNAVRSILSNNYFGNLIDGTDNIIRHTNTMTTHSSKSGNGGDGEPPYCGITKETCNITNVQGKNILLIDDVYTKSIGIDEDAIQALYDNGANKVFFYSIGKTIMRY